MGRWGRGARIAGSGVGVFVVLLVGFAAGAFAQWRGWVPYLTSARPPEDAAVRFGVFWEAWNDARGHYVDRSALDATTMTYGAIGGMLNALGDVGHTRFLSPADRQAEAAALSGQLEGVGVEVDIRDRQPTVVAPIPGSPAEKSGLRAGDKIMRVDGRDAVGLTYEQLGGLIRGAPGTSVTLTVLHPDQAQLVDVTVTRARVVVPSVTWARAPGTPIAHVVVSQFAEGADRQLVGAIRAARAAGAQAVALDLRNDPGGLRDEGIAVASEFLVDGNVLIERDAGGKETPYPVKGGGADLAGPLVVLVNGGTASSAEIVAGAIQDHRRAKLVGATTVGTGTVLATFPLSDGSAVLLGTAEWLTPNGRQIWRRGIAPDVPVDLPSDVQPLRPDDEAKLSPDQLKASKDAQLLRAYQELGAPPPEEEPAP